MTRFLLSLDDAVGLIFAAVRDANPGETFVPDVPSARVADIASVLIGDRPISIVATGVRPGEKIHEILVSEDECQRAVRVGTRFVIQPAVPELRSDRPTYPILDKEFSSSDKVLDRDALTGLLATHGLLESGRIHQDNEYP